MLSKFHRFFAGDPVIIEPDGVPNCMESREARRVVWRLENATTIIGPDGVPNCTKKREGRRNAWRMNT